MFEVAASINGVTYSPSTPVATPVSTASGTRTSGGATNTGRAGGNSGATGLSSPGPAFYFVSSFFLGALAAGQMLVL